jgi:hypothetical protein
MEELLERGVQARDGGLVPAGDAPPRLAPGVHLPEPLAELRAAHLLGRDSTKTAERRGIRERVRNAQPGERSPLTPRVSYI